MISHLSIRDFAIIENVDIDFYDGLNMITGETGAGKSIVIEAISLALGSRADTAYVRSGKDKAIVQLAADIDGEDYIITREVSAAGKNLCKINGQLVTLSELAPFCKKIADIHGQYDHQSLLNPEQHITLIDTYASADIIPVKERLSAEFKAYKDIQGKLLGIVSAEKENARKQDYMSYELSEIKKAQLKIGEDSELSERLAIFKNSERIYNSLSGAYQTIFEDSPSALTAVGSAMRMLQDISGFSEAIKGVSGEVEDAYYKLEAAMEEVRNIRDKLSFSPEELDECMARLDLIDGLKRKYGSSIEEILAYADKIEAQLSVIENSEQLKSKLAAELATAEKALRTTSLELSDIRKKAGEALCKKIEVELKELNFGNSSLSIRFEELKTSKGRYAYTENGIDKAEFVISTNLGEPQKPLAKIASGGEMSRIMLAFKRILADYDNIPTMIFDEIDTGISGIAASVVGKKLKQIAENHQIICITHLPQIAACGAHNYKIEKCVSEASTFTNITELDEEGKVTEIARLLGGLNITGTTLSSARELISASCHPLASGPQV